MHDAGVGVVGRAVLVPTVAGGQPQPAVGRPLDRTQPAELALEELPDVRDAVAADLQAVQPRATQARDVDDVTDDRDAAAGALGDRVRAGRRAEPAAGSGRALAARPAVVAALHDQVRLVHLAVAELLLPQPTLGVEGQTLDVAVAEAPDQRAGARGVRRHAAVRVHPQHLAVVVGAELLGVVAVLRVTGTGVELVVPRAPAQPPTVVELVARDALHQDLPAGQVEGEAGGHLDPHDPVVRGGR